MSPPTPTLPSTAARNSPGGLRGAVVNEASRFNRDACVVEAEFWDETLEPPDAERVPTQFLADDSQSIISRNTSPDISFDASVNPYRGCEHGCAYCYARPTHEYLGYSAGLDFETRILYKPRAAELLRAELARPGWHPQTLAFSGVTDCYQPVERRLRLTRACLEVLAEARHPTMILTKNALVARDIDVLAELAHYNCISVGLSVTTLRRDLQQRLEPRSSPPAARLEAIRRLREAGIPAGGMIGPVIPGINDHEILEIGEQLAAVGASFLRFVVLRLPHSVKEIFSDWLDRNEPGAKEKVLGRIRSMRGGKLYDASFGTRTRGTGIYAEQIQQLVEVARHRYGLAENTPHLSTEHFRRPSRTPGQMELDF